MSNQESKLKEADSQNALLTTKVQEEQSKVSETISKVKTPANVEGSQMLTWSKYQNDELLKQVAELQAQLNAKDARIKELESAASQPAAEPEVAQPAGAPGPEPVSPTA